MAFLFKLETRDGLPAEPPTLSAAVPNWSAGDVIALGAGRSLVVVGKRDDDADAPPVLAWRTRASPRHAAAQTTVHVALSRDLCFGERKLAPTFGSAG